MEAPIRYTRLYVVSDLHLGGETPFQIFKLGPELAALIRLAAADAPNERVGLVLNGDVIDYLAEANSRYLDPERAVAKLERVMGDPAFAMVFQALGEFVQLPGRELVLVLGNHDVELALPNVRERLLRELCGSSEAARGRVRLAVDGAGFSCEVGGRRVLCVHGNEVDPFNIIDFRQLLEVARASHRGQPIPEWVPNAGTKLVIDVMNGIKSKFPFVDLLKPETKPVPAVVFALDKEAAKRIAGLAPVMGRLVRDAVRVSFGLLGPGQEGDDDAPMQADPLAELVANAFPQTAGTRVDVDELLAEVERDVQRGTRADLPGGGDELLGTWGLLVDRLFRRDPVDNLLDALRGWLGKDATFQFDTEDDTFLKLDDAVNASVDFIVAGHTHLERSLKRRNGRGMYFNSGTWIRLIRLTQAMLANRQTFQPVYDALKAGTMSALDSARPGNAQLVVLRPTVVVIEQAQAGATGRLAHVRLGAETELVTVPGSERSV